MARFLRDIFLTFPVQLRHLRVALTAHVHARPVASNGSGAGRTAPNVLRYRARKWSILAVGLWLRSTLENLDCIPGSSSARLLHVAQIRLQRRKSAFNTFAAPIFLPLVLSPSLVQSVQCWSGLTFISAHSPRPVARSPWPMARGVMCVPPVRLVTATANGTPKPGPGPGTWYVDQVRGQWGHGRGRSC